MRLVPVAFTSTALLDAHPAPHAIRKTSRMISKKIFRLLGLGGYARLDFRLSRAGELYFLEANPNPILAEYEDFAESARKAGIPYPELIEKILRLARES